ncbi:alpha/beta hydrolase [Brachybacterium sp. J153]|uniref:alpha/beta hydrolase n=1 Tax=Brachybacterium sp. J153 TaxID=3116488 RepID=UPI002E7A721D|nr:alpha/beta hydrolase [Brachybacterium sp. J153]MEE1618083.1 alpha/beta hydrolase [Brachybacterium sp. J153]
MPRPAARRRRLASLLAVAAAGALVLGGCTRGADPGASDGGGQETGGETATASGGPGLTAVGASRAADLPADPATDPAYAAYYAQEIEWGECEQANDPRKECGTLTVPRLWDDPSAGDLEIAVARIPATGDGGKALVMNPGGPGASGTDYVDTMATLVSPQVMETYDQVGFDPRGVNGSEGLDCLSDAETDAYRADTLTATDPAEIRAGVLEGAERLAAGCEADDAELLPALDTASVARDMDVLRAALGQEKLDYFGYSYGTFLGALYAEQQPGRVGHMVLDGAVDPTLTLDEYAAGQADGFRRALDAFLASCLAAGTDCPFEGDADAALQQLADLLADIDAEPLPTSDPDRPLTGALARSALMSLMYSDSLWEFGRSALADAADGDGTQLLTFADQSAQRRSDGSYRTNSNEVMSAISCLDRPAVADPAWQDERAAELAAADPVFGPGFAHSGTACSVWPVPPLRESAPISAAGAGPILVLGTTGDPATPYAWSESLAGQLEGGVLLTFEANGHTAYGRSGGCIEQHVDRYLLDAAVPEEGTVC